MAKEDEVFAHVLEAEKMFVRNREEMLKYEAQERYEMDLATREGLAEARGEAKGRAEGKAEGRAEGRAEGKLEALLTTAKRMLKAGMSIKEVIEFTNLTEQQLSQIKE